MLLRQQVGREFYLTKESDNYTAFIKQLINTVIESAIDKYEKESYYLITLYLNRCETEFKHNENLTSVVKTERSTLIISILLIKQT